MLIIYKKLLQFCMFDGIYPHNKWLCTCCLAFNNLWCIKKDKSHGLLVQKDAICWWHVYLNRYTKRAFLSTQVTFIGHETLPVIVCESSKNSMTGSYFQYAIHLFRAVLSSYMDVDINYCQSLDEMCTKAKVMPQK